MIKSHRRTPRCRQTFPRAGRAMMEQKPVHRLERSPVRAFLPPSTNFVISFCCITGVPIAYMATQANRVHLWYIGGLPKLRDDEIDIRHLHVFVRGLPKLNSDENREITCQNARERFPASSPEPFAMRSKRKKAVGGGGAAPSSAPVTQNSAEGAPIPTIPLDDVILPPDGEPLNVGRFWGRCP